MSEAEAAVLRDYDAKVLNLIDVDDFAPHELRAGGGAGANLDRAREPPEETAPAAGITGS
jgi:hypothetical protein